jgi:hypothetical protein
MSRPAGTRPPPGYSTTRASASFAASPEHLLAMKALAVRPRDAEDIRQLTRVLSLRTVSRLNAFPLSVDGIEIVASLVLLADRRAGRQSGWLPWAALAVGTAGSLAANIATAGPGIISRVIAGWPALALLIAVKLLSGMLDRHGSSPPGAVPARPEPARESVSLPCPAPMPVASRPPGVAGPGTAAVPRRGTVPDVADLLPAARAARDGFLRDGRPVTRDALAARLRANGQPVRNARFTALLRALRTETPAPAAAAR